YSILQQVYMFCPTLTDCLFFFFFFFNDPAPTEIYTLSLHDALPICIGSSPTASRLSERYRAAWSACPSPKPHPTCSGALRSVNPDRKSTRLNSSHVAISYAVFCLKKKNNKKIYRNEKQAYPPDGLRE